MKHRVTGTAWIMSLALIGCGEVPDTDVETTEGAWSEANCTIATADATFTGGVAPEYVSPSTYSNARCGKAVVIDMLNYSSTYFGAPAGGPPPNADGRTQIDWNGSLPTTQAACLDLWMGTILYRRSGGAWVEQIHRETQGGQWARDPFTGVFVCRGPSMAFHTTFAPELVVGRNYRLAVTARTQPSSSAPTRSVRINSFRPEVIR